MLAVTVGPSVGGGFLLNPKASPYDGQLDLFFVKTLGIFKLARYIPKVIRGTHEDVPELFQQRIVGAEIERSDGRFLFLRNGWGRYAGSGDIPGGRGSSRGAPCGSPEDRGMKISIPHTFWTIPGALVILGCLSDPARAQVPDSLATSPPANEEAVSTDEAPVGRISPRGAFIRSALIPGWGHAKVGAMFGGLSISRAEAASALMIYKTHTRIGRTRRMLSQREAVVTARLEAGGMTDPDEIEAALAEDPEIEDLRSLEETRSGQREDWIALGLFMMLIGGVDGYVSAHLADFPAAVVLEPTPGGGMEISFSLSVGF